jgi:hypothetical protein
VESVEPVNATTFRWQVSGAGAPPTSGKSVIFGSATEIASSLPADKVRAKLVAHLKSNASSNFALSQEDVPEDRIVVTLP